MLNSVMFNFGLPPKFIARDPRAFRHGFQLGPHDRGMDATVERGDAENDFGDPLQKLLTGVRTEEWTHDC